MTATISPAQDYTIAACTYTVPGSKAGTFYTVAVDVTDGRVLDCTCPSFIHRGRCCRHMKLVSQKDHGGIKPRLRVVMRSHTAPTAPNMDLWA